MNTTEFTLAQSLLVILPEIGLALLAIVVIGLDVGIPAVMRPLGEGRKQLTAVVCGVVLGLLAAITLLLPPGTETIPQGLYWGGMI
ncbi:MAG: hypothetical protein K8I30_23585, partial [Anaerolineae bacterium]|nr:hypothetical protein [Anaerolineae bacterium]